tara:strand:+ start:919 stop:1122 length:204 start_codon:yes stop_codon:yes gene_type:complete
MRYILKTCDPAPVYLAAFYLRPSHRLFVTAKREDACSYGSKERADAAKFELKRLFSVDADVVASSYE